MPKSKKLALKSGIQTNQVLANNEVCIPRLSSILFAVSYPFVCSSVTNFVCFLSKYGSAMPICVLFS